MKPLMLLGVLEGEMGFGGLLTRKLAVSFQMEGGDDGDDDDDDDDDDDAAAYDSSAGSCFLKAGRSTKPRESSFKGFWAIARHILNLGHGVLQGTPEENVLFFVEEAQSYGH